MKGGNQSLKTSGNTATHLKKNEPLSEKLSWWAQWWLGNIKKYLQIAYTLYDENIGCISKVKFLTKNIQPCS